MPFGFGGWGPGNTAAAEVIAYGIAKEVYIDGTPTIVAADWNPTPLVEVQPGVWQRLKQRFVPGGSTADATPPVSSPDQAWVQNAKKVRLP